jgi:hypothetical protein
MKTDEDGVTKSSISSYAMAVDTIPQHVKKFSFWKTVLTTHFMKMNR